MFSLPGAASQINWFLPSAPGPTSPSTGTSVSGAQFEGPSAVIGQGAFLSTSTKSQPKPKPKPKPKPAQGPRSVIELEEERLRAAHLALLEIGTPQSGSSRSHRVSNLHGASVEVLKTALQPVWLPSWHIEPLGE
jgi:hypothetical protein